MADVPLPPVDGGELLEAELEGGGGLGYLAGVSGHRHPLAVQNWRDVHGGAHQHAGYADVGAHQAEVAGQDRLLDQVRLHEVEVLPIHGGLVEGLHLRPGGGHASRPVYLDVIGMPVDAEFVVDDQGDGRFLPQELGEPVGDLDGIGCPQRSGSGVGGVARQPGVPVAQELHPGGAEQRRRPFGLVAADGGQVIGSGRVLVRKAQLAARRHHEHDSVAGVAQAGEGPTREDGLVVGVGMEEHHRAPHGASVHQLAASTWRGFGEV